MSCGRICTDSTFNYCIVYKLFSSLQLTFVKPWGALCYIVFCSWCGKLLRVSWQIVLTLHINLLLCLYFIASVNVGEDLEGVLL